MRLLYLDVCAQFINPTRNLLPTVIGLAADTVFYGPGYVDSKRLSGGIRQFIDGEGPFDAVLISPHVIFGDLYKLGFHTCDFFRYYSCSFPKVDLMTLHDMALELENLSLPRIGVILESDSYNFQEGELSRIDQRTEASITTGEQFFKEIVNLANLKDEAFESDANDKWIRYARQNTERIASFPHIIGENEFNYTALALRKHAWSVMGVNYHARKIAHSRLKSAGIKPVKDGWVRKFMAGLKRVRIVRKELPAYLNYINADFRERIASTRYSYTCGSGLELPIRKVFEIPAAGAVLVCRPFSGFEELGFVDKKNAIICEPEDVVEVHRWLESDISRAQHIADAGRTMVLKNHSVKARAEQFRAIVESVINGTFSGGKWEKGEYKTLYRSVGEEENEG